MAGWRSARWLNSFRTSTLPNIGNVDASTLVVPTQTVNDRTWARSREGEPMRVFTHQEAAGGAGQLSTIAIARLDNRFAVGIRKANARDVAGGNLFITYSLVGALPVIGAVNGPNLLLDVDPDPNLAFGSLIAVTAGVTASLGEISLAGTSSDWEQLPPEPFILHDAATIIVLKSFTANVTTDWLIALQAIRMR